MEATYNFGGYDLPVDLINKTGGGVDKFDELSRHHMNLLRRFLAIESDHNVLEIGCGIGRDAIPLTQHLSASGSYLGIDIIRPSIEFCQQHISPKHPNFKFVHFDIADALHNPGGVQNMVDCQVPLEDNTVDRVFAWSVLTHLWEEDIRHYFKEFARVLKPGGLCYLSCFLLSPDIIAAAQKVNLTPYDLTFRHQIDPHCWVNNPDMPLGAIGYSAEAFRQMAADSGLTMDREFIRGLWSGYWPDPEDGQDGMLLRKPALVNN